MVHLSRQPIRKNIDGGWTVIAVDDKDENEAYVIEQELIDMIIDHAQAPDVDIVLRENDDEN